MPYEIDSGFCVFLCFIIVIRRLENGRVEIVSLSQIDL